MEKQNTTKEVRERMAGMIARKQKDMFEIESAIAEQMDALTAANSMIRDAIERTDPGDYEDAKKAKHKAENTIEMYSRRLEQLREREYLTEKESDEVIDQLLEYEATLDEEFRRDIKAPLQKAAEVLQAYKNAMFETESTLREWQEEIHANYNTRGGSSFYDPETGGYTDRSPRPVPVHYEFYYGINESNIIGKLLNNPVIMELYQDEQ